VVAGVEMGAGVASPSGAPVAGAEGVVLSTAGPSGASPAMSTPGMPAFSTRLKKATKA
jgi:hypothetical protein